jgi:hypothetical protein
MTAAQLIKVLAQHITEHGNVPVMLPLHYPPSTHKGQAAVVRCWWDDDAKRVIIEAL